jgi:hypothetical protein
VKVPTGGIQIGLKAFLSARERISNVPSGAEAMVSRSGAIPEPTVTVRMKENGN